MSNKLIWDEQKQEFESPAPLDTIIELHVYGDVNNLSLATAIYDWYKDCIGHNGLIDLTVVARMLEMQTEHDGRRYSNE